MGLRLLDLDKKLRSDFWVNGKSGVLGAAGMTGHFIGGEGVFQASDTEDGKPVLYRGVWDRIVPGRSHRWYQAASYDNARPGRKAGRWIGSGARASAPECR